MIRTFLQKETAYVTTPKALENLSKILISFNNIFLVSSDTESAVGGRERSRLSALGARMRAALPRARDRVQATEPTTDTDDKILAEEKKGVVYAELQLGEQTAEKPPPPSTEYAEIVYTDKNQQETKE
ncbi:hypothetical protein RR46_12391 [Papilio xuthus]|uniref:Uncharacterized protein n=1 Tax=Papilio xuthus TaxID=66420 RepID=A0A194PSE7_PAPXU|nr:hypothetical protein RR46_12391 [Papilio xuthus]